MIIVDTSGRHKQEESLFEEMLAVANAVVSLITIYYFLTLSVNTSTATDVPHKYIFI